MKFLFAVFALLYLEFIGATFYALVTVFTGGTQFTVYLNTYGERWADVAIIAALYLAGLVALACLYRRLWRETRREAGK